jgi:carbon storage regulator CsrA
LGIKGSKVLVGIEAPGNVSVHRLEVADKIKKEQGEK